MMSQNDRIKIRSRWKKNFAINWNSRDDMYETYNFFL